MARSPKAATADILAKFPGPVTLYPSKLHLAHLFLISIIFFVLGIWSLQFGENSHFDRAISIAGMIMGGLGVPMFALAFLPKAAFLRLDGAGFEYADCFYRRQFAWSNVGDFRVWVGQRGVRWVSFNMPWRSHFLPQFLPDSYGFTVDETAALMASWRNLAIPLSGKQVDIGEQRFVAQAERLGRSFTHVTMMQWIGTAVIGLAFVAALIVFFISIHTPQSTEPTEPSTSTGMLSNHGPKRVACDFKWSTLQQPDPDSVPGVPAKLHER